MARNFADRLRRALELRKMKQIDLARKTGITKGAISQYLSGEYMAKQDNVYKIADALNVDAGWLMGEDVPMELGVNIEIDFTDPVSAMKFILEQPTLMAYGGYDLEMMSDEEILEIANDLLYALRISAERHKSKKD
jgi:transcriptional regulator with XRE-family HTH domain